MAMEINNGYVRESWQINLPKRKGKDQETEKKVTANMVNMNVMKAAKVETITIKLDEKTVERFESS